MAGIAYTNTSIDPQQINAAVEAAMNDRDTNGNPAPTYRPRTYTYDDSGNRKTETVTDANGTWVKTYTYANGVTAGDSGWVKQ